MFDMSIETALAGATLIALGVVTVALAGALFLFVRWLLRRRPKPLPPALSFFDVIGRRGEPRGTK